MRNVCSYCDILAGQDAGAVGGKHVQASLAHLTAILTCLVRIKSQGMSFSSTGDIGEGR